MQSVGAFVPLLLLTLANLSQAVDPDPPSLRPIVINGNYSENYTKQINSTIEYVFLYSESNVRIEFVDIFLCLVVNVCSTSNSFTLGNVSGWRSHNGEKRREPQSSSDRCCPPKKGDPVLADTSDR